MPALPTGTVSFLFTDIEGSTRLLRRLGRDSYADILNRHHQLLRSVAGEAVVSTEGDSFFCAFASSTTAVGVAVEAQRLLHQEDWGHDVGPEVRMGIHTGEGVLGGDAYVGLDVHRAARIAAAAHGGQVLISEATRTLVGHELPSGVGIRDLGAHRLKDLADPERLYQLTIEGLPGAFPPPNSLDAAASRLPEYLTRFVGREAEVQLVADTLEKGRLITLTGIGGSGKTRLAVEVGRRHEERYPGGAHFISLEAAPDAPGVAKAIAVELGVSEQLGTPVEETLMDHLESSRSLLILDGCEQAAGGAVEIIEKLLLGCPRLQVLATSREPFHLRGESVIQVGPMRLLDIDSEGAEAAMAADAVALFVARATAASPGLDVRRWAHACVEICHRLEGIPLAIELAAARASVLTPGDILDRLDDRFSLLTARNQGEGGRHSALEAVIDWSYELLDDEMRRLARALSVFRGGFTVKAVAEVCFAEPADEMAVLDRLAELSDKSLITRQLEAPGVRFRQLDTIREFALVRLHRSGEFEEVEDRHRSFFIGMARDQAHLLGGADQLESLHRLEADHDNLKAVIIRSLDEGRIDDAAAMAGWLSWFWYLRSHFEEGERWARELLGSMPERPNRTWLRLLIGAGQYDFRIGAYDRAEERLRKALVIAADQQVSRMQMWARAYLATNDLYRMELDSARDLADQAADEASQIGDMLGYAYATYVSLTARAARMQADSKLEHETAVGLARVLAPIAKAVEATGERNMIGHVSQTEGILAWFAGDAGRAASAFDRAIDSLTELGQVGCACHCLEAIARFVVVSDLGSAAQIIGAVDHIRGQIGIGVAPVEELIRSEAVSLARDGLGETEYAAAAAAGSRMSLQEAAQVARQALARI